MPFPNPRNAEKIMEKELKNYNQYTEQLKLNTNSIRVSFIMFAKNLNFKNFCMIPEILMIVGFKMITKIKK